jgi:hypothetical protein
MPRRRPVFPETCASCRDRVEDMDPDHPAPKLQCSHDQCGWEWIGERECPDCHRPFSRRLDDDAFCPACEEPVDELEGEARKAALAADATRVARDLAALDAVCREREHYIPRDPKENTQ